MGEWRTVKKAGYKEVTTYEEEIGYENKCEEQWVCLDYPKPDSLKNCYNKKWEPTGDCKSIHVDQCKDVKFTAYKDEKKCEKEKVQKCNKEPKTVKKEVHKRVPTSIEGKIAYRVCPGKKDHEYTPTETREMNFTGY